MKYQLAQLNIAQAKADMESELMSAFVARLDEINALADKPMLFKMGETEIPFTTDNFMLSFSLPNFYFHATTTYAVLREHGVPLGKMDYLGQLRVNL